MKPTPLTTFGVILKLWRYLREDRDEHVAVVQSTFRNEDDKEETWMLAFTQYPERIENLLAAARAYAEQCQRLNADSNPEDFLFSAAKDLAGIPTPDEGKGIVLGTRAISREEAEDAGIELPDRDPEPTIH